MTKNIVYMLGAGASFHALPIVSNLNSRFKIFCDHILDYNQKYSEARFVYLKREIAILLEKISSHYTIDTYARKLYLKNPAVDTNSDYIQILKFLSAYFLYEQLTIDINSECNRYLKNLYEPVKGTTKIADQSLLNELDYRYDSFFATILENSEEGELVIPKNFSILSWNYDFQVEKAYMNFSGNSLDDTLNQFKVDGINHKLGGEPKKTFLTKLNGTAAFVKDGKYTNLFDFKTHTLNEESLDILSKILSSPRSEFDTGMRFAWQDDEFSKRAIKQSQIRIRDADIVVIIGYSFPYFNRSIDRLLFKEAGTLIRLPKVYIQGCENDVKSVINRFKGIRSDINAIPFVELDQFLIPNEL